VTHINKPRNLARRKAKPKEVKVSDEKKKEEKTSIGHKIWKFFGAMIMDEKSGTYALSLTRVMAVVLFIVMLWTWLFTGEVDPTILKILTENGIDAAGTIEQLGDVPDKMLYTFWTLLGVKSVNTVAGKVKAKLGGE